MKPEKAKALLAEPIDLKSLSPSHARVAIAKDALAGIRLGKLRPEEDNGYLYILRSRNEERKAGQLRDILGLPDVKCEVCALGALFSAEVARTNAIKVRRGWCVTDKGFGWGQSLFTSRLADYFSHTQLWCIEMAFEGFLSSWGMPVRDERECREFFWRCSRNPRKRLEQILHNIIHNDGTFVPLQRPIPLSKL